MDSLISCCATAGVAEWVCCPGERNAPLLLALARCPEIHRWMQQDERSAAYFALGRIQATARAVAVLAGSGSSAAALLPAIIEAYYQRRPLIIVTLDSQEPMEGTGAWGCIEQESLFGFYAPTVELSLPCAVADLPDMTALCAEGFPVHLHIRCAPSVVRGEGDIIRVADPPEPPRFRGSLAKLSQILRFHAEVQGLVLILGELDPAEQEPALWLARTLRVPVLAEATSGLREKLAGLLLHGGDTAWPGLCPGYVLRLGGVPSFPAWRALENMPHVEVISITRSGFSGLRRESTVIEGDLEQIMKALGDVHAIGDSLNLLPAARKHSGRVEELLMSYPESSAALVRAFSQQASLADVMFLGSPSATRLWNRYAQQQVPVLYTRTVSQAGGADGAVSAFLGNAVDAGFACALVGDIALLRDIAGAMLLPQLPPGKRVIAVLNNEGAGMADRAEWDDELRRLIVQPPDIDIQEFAQLCHAEYYAIHSEADFEVIEGLDEDSLAILDLQPDRTLDSRFRI